jgi:hypothetical protein
LVNQILPVTRPQLNEEVLRTVLREARDRYLFALDADERELLQERIVSLRARLGIKPKRHEAPEDSGEFSYEHNEYLRSIGALA